MDAKSIVRICRDMGCCDCCCLRFVGVMSPFAYVNCHNHILPYLPIQTNGYHSEESSSDDNNDSPAANNAAVAGVLARFPPDPQTLSKNPIPRQELEKTELAEPSAKRKKSDNCVTCLGLLQKATWEHAADMVKEVIEKKQYDATSFAAALSAPICTIYRERVVLSRLIVNVPDFDPDGVTSLKEAWKWAFGPYLARVLGLKLDSGKFAPLLITLNYEYPDDLQELEILKTLSPAHFTQRAQQRRFTVEFTRRSVMEALDDVEDSVLAVKRLTANNMAACVSVVACHEPVYLAGRYIKLSRVLPQTPWLVQGRRMVASSVQDILFTPIARLYGMAMEDIEHRLKFMSAGREDVDVRCLGDGRPFAIEISDPRRSLTRDELSLVCQEISQDNQVIVKQLVHVNKEALIHLKRGEEIKSKTYDALVVKLKPVNDSTPLKFEPSPVTEKDIECINNFAPVTLLQRTPVRVLHRRPLLTRRREIYELKAEMVKDQPTLIKLQLKAEAGTYIKEFVHGECGRTQPSLSDALKPKPVKTIPINIEGEVKTEGEDEAMDLGDKEKELDNVDDKEKESDKSGNKEEQLDKKTDTQKQIPSNADTKSKNINETDTTNIEGQDNDNETENNNKIETRDNEKPEDIVRFDILALDVESVNLNWPIIISSDVQTSQ